MTDERSVLFIPPRSYDRGYQNAGIQDGWHHWDARLKLFLLVVAIGLNLVVAQVWLSLSLLVVSLFFIVRSKIPFRLFAVFFLAPA
jgi:hypothetical protein